MKVTTNYSKVFLLNIGQISEKKHSSVCIPLTTYLWFKMEESLVFAYLSCTFQDITLWLKE